MKIDPINILLNKAFTPDKKFYFISGNEKTLMEKIKSKIIESFQKKSNIQIKTIDTINDFVNESGLFETKSIFVVNGLKGIDIENLNIIKASNYNFIFLQKIKK